MLAACGSLALGGVAQAQEDEGISFAFNLGANTDYVFRGISQTAEDPSVYGGIDASAGIGYAGSGCRTSTSATGRTWNTTSTPASSRPWAR
jgi:uncharacterized protein (TIGR02001 family)